MLSAILGLFLAINKLTFFEGWDPVEKYRTCILVGFVGTFILLKRKGFLAITLVVVGWVLLSYAINFKAFLAIGLLLPLYFFLPPKIFKSKLLYLFLIFITVVGLAYPTKISILMTASIDFLNIGTEIVNKSKSYDDLSTIWRIEIWKLSIEKISENLNWILGLSPGFNFMNSNYLGTPFALSDDPALEGLRTPHNFLILLVMRFGVIGFLFYLYFYLKWRPKHSSKTILLFELSIFVSALSAEILERNARGPLFLIAIGILSFYNERLKSIKT